MRGASRIGLILAAGVLAACAHAPAGPSVLRAPEVAVQSFVPVVTNPDVMKFRSVLQIRNPMDAPVRFARVDYGADLFDQPVFTDQFADLKETAANDTQTVTFPFQISLKTILDAVASGVAERKLRVAFHGTLYAENPAIPPVPFSQTLEVPLPRLPEVSYQGSDGVPLGPDFQVRIGLKNTNAFPISVDNVDSTLSLNGENYRLVHTLAQTELAPGQQQVLTLRMKNSPRKMLSMFVNVVSSQAAHFTLGGSVTFGTPFGAIYLPVSVSDR